jgi:hypothetical protein
VVNRGGGGVGGGEGEYTSTKVSQNKIIHDMVLYSTYTYKLLSDGTNQGRFNIFWNNLSVGVFYISGSIPDSREIENGKSSVACIWCAGTYCILYRLWALRSKIFGFGILLHFEVRYQKFICMLYFW